MADAGVAGGGSTGDIFRPATGLTQQAGNKCPHAVAEQALQFFPGSFPSPLQPGENVGAQRLLRVGGAGLGQQLAVTVQKATNQGGGAEVQGQTALIAHR
jgi:hypothetical protein